jgi:hypothetical protein
LRNCARTFEKEEIVVAWTVALSIAEVAMAVEV